MNTLNTVYRRVNSRELPQMVGQNVRLVGKCLNADESGDFLLLETSDGGQVQIKRSHGSSMVHMFTTTMFHSLTLHFAAPNSLAFRGSKRSGRNGHVCDRKQHC